ncbi:MAG: MFS transporter [Chlamydiae bacterium]|nr:MFS transporter [Chlamydiota bacterium]
MKQDKFFELPIMIWVIGASALLSNLSSIMIFSLTPLYLTQVFGLATFHLGILEGIVEFCSWAIRIFSGVFSDYLKKRKPLLIVAYALTILARPIFALAPNIGWIYSAKLLDRISNGLQATPREALVGDVAPKEKKGACYGLRQSLGFAGSILGALIVMFVMGYAQNNFKLIFWIAGIPSLLALLAMIFFVKDVVAKSDKIEKSSQPFSIILKNVLHLDFDFWKLILVAGVFMTSNFSGAYRILQADHIGFSLASVSIVMLVQNIGALSAFPMGKLSDKSDRRRILAIGFFITILADLFLGLVNNAMGIIAGSILWGAQMGITQSIFQSMIADSIHPDLRGTGFGIYYLVVACALLAANSVMGYMFQAYGSTMGFMLSAMIAFIGLLLIGILKPSPKKVPVDS